MPQWLTVYPTNCVVYDQRIQQVSNTLLGNLASCLKTITTTACTTNADCASFGPSEICLNGVCQEPTPGCNFEILLTTLSAHSSDFVVPVGNGDHKVLMHWAEIGKNNSVGEATLSCVGPVTLTVQQVKNFSNDQQIIFNTN